MIPDYHTTQEIYKHRLAERERYSRYVDYSSDTHSSIIQRFANSTGRLLMHLGERLAEYGYDANTTLVTENYTKGTR